MIRKQPVAASPTNPLISGLGCNGTAVRHGLEMPIRCFSGARSARVIGGSNNAVDEHSHDWPVLSLYVLGECHKKFDGGEIRIAGPSAVLHGARAAHANRLGDVGHEQIDIQFDPRWLGAAEHVPTDRVFCWLGGPIAAAAAWLRSLWLNPAIAEDTLAKETAQFLQSALRPHKLNQPAWFEAMEKRIQVACSPSASSLAAEFGLHPSWLAQAYRQSAGEGIRQTLQRRRVEHATILLEGSEAPAADIAAAAGFCDQSHMNRTFRILLGRTPTQIRSERKQLLRT